MKVFQDLSSEEDSDKHPRTGHPDATQNLPVTDTPFPEVPHLQHHPPRGPHATPIKFTQQIRHLESHFPDVSNTFLFTPIGVKTRPTLGKGVANV